MAFKKTSGEKIGEVKEVYATLSESPTSDWTTIYGSISWKNGTPKDEIRKVNLHADDGPIFGKGVSLSEEELNILTDTLVSRGFGDTNFIKNEIENR